MKTNRWILQTAYAAMLLLMVTSLSAPAQADRHRGGWTTAEKLLQMDGNQVPGGCPIESPGGRFLFVAKNPEGDNIDIYVNERYAIGEPFLGDNILDEVISHPGANDFCPTPLTDGELYFESNRMAEPPDIACGETDILTSTLNPATGYSKPVNLGCYPHGPNTPGTEFSPSLVTNEWGTFLFFSTDYFTGTQDIVVSYQRRNGTFTAPIRLGWPINTMEWDDKQPNVSQDGKEIVFASNRPNEDGIQSANDIFYAKRRFIFLPWSEVTNLSEEEDFPTEAADETRPSMSWDGERLVYGSMGVWQSERRRGRRSF